MQLAEPADEAAQALNHLRRIVRALRITTHKVERDVAINGAQLFVLRELAEEPGISLRRLSERTLTDPSSVSVVVSRLVKRGMIARQRDKADARRSVLALSARGQKLLARAPEPFQSRLVTALRALPRPHLRRLNSALGELVLAVGIADRAAPMFLTEEPKRVNRRGA